MPARERVFSIFEPHAELIQRGKRQKPVEFGHKVLLCQTREKFITDYAVYEKQQADCAVDRVGDPTAQALFGGPRRFWPATWDSARRRRSWRNWRSLVGTLAIPRRLRDFADKVLAKWQAFRAGIEGTISGLKRAFRLFRCFLSRI